MKTTYATFSGALNCAVRLIKKFNRDHAFVTMVESGDLAGFYTVTPDRLSDKSEKVIYEKRAGRDFYRHENSTK